LAANGRVVFNKNTGQKSSDEKLRLNALFWTARERDWENFTF
jgi:hypothetical protein